MKTGVSPHISSLQRCNAALTASFEWNGLHIRDLSAPFGSRSSFAIIDVIPMAKHPLCSSSLCEKYYYLLTGQLHFHCGNSDVVLTRQDFLIIPPNTEFAYANRSNRLAQLLLVHTPGFSQEHEIVRGDFFKDMNIYHVATKSTWTEGHTSAGTYTPPSLESEGYIHFCDHAMVPTVANHYFPDAGELTVAEVNPSLVAPQLRYEKSGNDDRHYPHVYGALNTNAVVRSVTITKDNGVFDCSEV